MADGRKQGAPEKLSPFFLPQQQQHIAFASGNDNDERTTRRGERSKSVAASPLRPLSPLPPSLTSSQQPLKSNQNGKLVSWTKSTNWRGTHLESDAFRKNHSRIGMTLQTKKL